MRNQIAKNMVLRTERVKPRREFEDIDTSKSQQYFDAVFRHGDGFVGLITDIDVLQDSKTPDVLKQYIQQHSCRTIQSSSVPSQLSDNMRGDEIVPVNVQTFGEYQAYINANKIDL